VFGLHPNAALTFRRLQVAEALGTAADVMPSVAALAPPAPAAAAGSGDGGGGGASSSAAAPTSAASRPASPAAAAPAAAAAAARASGPTREQEVDRVAADLLARLPPAFDKEQVRERLRLLPGGPLQPLTVHLRQEVDRLGAVLSAVRQTLSQLRLALAGAAALSGPLPEALAAIHSGKPPPAWAKLGWEASSLGGWFGGLLQRHEQLVRWLRDGRPRSFWLGGFFNPQGFLTAVRQEVARHHAGPPDRWALDDVGLKSEVLHPPKTPEQLREAPAEGVYVHGLWLEGAAWGAREGRLVDSAPRQLFAELPVLYVTGACANSGGGSAPAAAAGKGKAGASGSGSGGAPAVYEAPVYRTRARRGNNFITTFSLRTDDPPSKWVLRGVALLCAID
jgi:dynein heavy chain